MKHLPFFLSPDFILSPPVVMAGCGLAFMWLVAVPVNASRWRRVLGYTLVVLGWPTSLVPSSTSKHNTLLGVVLYYLIG